MRMLAYLNASGSSVWRVIDPWSVIKRKHPELDLRIAQKGIREKDLPGIDAVVLQSIVDKEGIALLRAWQVERGLKIICDVDDWHFDLNSDNAFIKSHEATDASFVIKRTLEIADAITTTTPYLANNLRKLSPNVYVFPNYISKNRWQLVGKKPIKYPKTLRIGWTGSLTHLDDFNVCIDALRWVLKRPNVELVIMGDPRIASLFDGYSNIESHLGLPMEYYPDKLAKMHLDIGIAPLRDTEFNRCKSNIKVLEYGINHVPVIASDVYPYRQMVNMDVGCLVKNNEWFDALAYMLDNPMERLEMGQHLYEKVMGEYLLEKNALKLYEIYKKVIDQTNVV